MRGNEIKCDISPPTTTDMKGIILSNIFKIFPTKFYLDRGVSWDGVTAGINHRLAVSVVRSVADLTIKIRTNKMELTLLYVSVLVLLDLLKFIVPLKNRQIFPRMFYPFQPLSSN